jgi:hypothetical protein
MDRREAAALDRHITGNYGEDQMPEESNAIDAMDAMVTDLHKWVQRQQNQKRQQLDVIEAKQRQLEMDKTHLLGALGVLQDVGDMLREVAHQ